MRIALVHEFLTQLGGAERVLENFLEEWPQATLHVLVYDKERTFGVFDKYSKRISVINAIPNIARFHRWFLPMMPKLVENFEFSDFDVVLSDSSSFAKGVLTDGKLHICYCHTPTRFLWTESDKYIEAQPHNLLVKFLAKKFIPILKRWDLKASKRPDFFIANSENVRKRIMKYYNRDSVVIPPPVDTEAFFPDGERQNFYLAASRLEPYKKIELAILAFNELGLPLKVAGVGTYSDKLRALAGPNIEFLGRVSDEELRRLYSQAQAFVFPAEEDAGIMVLEAQACGTPVIAYGAGGSLETIKSGVTGEFFTEQTVASLKQVVQSFDSSKYNTETIRAHALEYDKQVFRKKIHAYIQEKLAERGVNV